MRVFNYTMVNGTQGLQCNTTAHPNIEGSPLKELVMCNATYQFSSNGTYSINVTAWDGLFNYNTTTIYYTVDQIPPVLRNLTASINSSNFLTGTIGNYTPRAPSVGVGTARQGNTLYFLANFTDNLTRPLDATLQFLNGSTWQTLNVTQGSSNITPSTLNIGGIANLTFVIPTGRNEFEGRNITFRVFANDTLGNVNISSSVNLTIQINDTYAPEIIINSSVLAGDVSIVNGTNTTNT